MPSPGTGAECRRRPFDLATCHNVHPIQNLLTELIRLDQFLEHSGQRFLTADRLTHLDCSILPKLHSIRIAAKALKDFEIPVDLFGVWRYLREAYATDVFRKSCPSDQEIVLYWADRKDTPDLPPQRRSQLSRQKPLYTLFVPKGSCPSNDSCSAPNGEE
ncbi:EXL-1 protein [Aphelenchoides avenae]|nr:EXL-1 protein [Aphelenchus avenae]